MESLDKLKSDWLVDPCWDIEDTPGFEEHREELVMFHQQMREKWRLAEEERLQRKAEKIGCPGNLALARYVDALEARVRALEER